MSFQDIVPASVSAPRCEPLARVGQICVVIVTRQTIYTFAQGGLTYLHQDSPAKFPQHHLRLGGNCSTPQIIQAANTRCSGSSGQSVRLSRVPGPERSPRPARRGGQGPQ
jgi:hypothetical protein